MPVTKTKPTAPTPARHPAKAASAKPTSKPVAADAPPKKKVKSAATKARARALKKSKREAAKANDPRPVIKVDKNGREYRESNAAARVEVDEDQLSLLVKIGCTMDEIAEVLKVSKDTIERHYMHVVHSARKERNVVIRRKQYQLAMEGDRTMLVWLGKQWLGQTDQLQLGNNPDNPLTPGAQSVIEIVFVESDGDGRLKTIEGEVLPKQITSGGKTNAGE